MTAKLDITGHRYGRLIAIERLPLVAKRSPWRFQCDCGNEVTLPLERVRAGIAKSCGCLRIDVTRARSVTHGHSLNRTQSRTLKAYSHAKARCQNPNDAKYSQYGGRGISMCAAWSDSFEIFLADMGPCPEGKTLDRIDVHGNYEPGNCRWADAKTQSRNRTDNVYVVHGGQRMILKDFAAVMRVNYKSLHARVKYKGMTPIEAAASLSPTSQLP